VIEGLNTLFVIVTIAAATPIVLGLMPRLGIPAVVIFLVAGVIVGPYALDVANPNDVELLSKMGLGFLFLLAGYEVKLEWFRERAGTLAIGGWFISLAIATAVTGALELAGYVKAFVPISLALTTTALGTLLPILRDAGMLHGRFRTMVMASGAVGELFPVIAIAVFLSSTSQFAGLASIVVIGLLAFGLAKLPGLIQGSRIDSVVSRGVGNTSQTTLRLAVALLVGLLVLANDLGDDIVLGAFVAGMVLRRWGPADVNAIDSKLDALGYGFFIPIFFIASGMGIDIDSIAESPLRLLVFFVLLLAVRGLPTMLVYLRDLSPPKRIQLTFLNATALPLLVALTEIGLRTGTMLPENAAALVGAGALSVLVFPLIATRIHTRGKKRHPENYVIDADDDKALLPDIREP